MESTTNLPPQTPWRTLSDSQARKVEAISATFLSHLDYMTDRRLQKAYYLAEVWSIEERLERLSQVDFASWHHGPWSLHVREGTERLESSGTVERIFRLADDGLEIDFLKVTSPVEFPELRREEAEFLVDVSAALRFMKSAKLTYVAKATTPFRLTPPEARIDLDAYLESLRQRHAKLVNSPKVAALVAEAKAA
jgi:uncharacterized phage-associated protein